MALKYKTLQVQVLYLDSGDDNRQDTSPVELARSFQKFRSYCSQYSPAEPEPNLASESIVLFCTFLGYSAPIHLYNTFPPAGPVSALGISP